MRKRLLMYGAMHCCQRILNSSKKKWESGGTDSQLNAVFRPKPQSVEEEETSLQFSIADGFSHPPGRDDCGTMKSSS
jgi:hypothetical protein